MSIFEWAVVVFITLSILYHVWRGGARNPQSTGELGRKVTGLSSKLTTLSSRVGNVEEELDELKREAATVKDIQRIEERIETVRAEMAGHQALSANTNRNVERIYNILLEKGLGK